MNDKNQQSIRIRVLCAFVIFAFICYLGILYDVQVNHYDEYLSRSIRSIAIEEKVEASRGIITDRKGRVLVSSRPSYNLTFDATRLKEGEDQNTSILKLLELCQDYDVTWTDNLPISKCSPFSYNLDQMPDTQIKRFVTYIKSLPEAKDLLGAYLVRHPEYVHSNETMAILEQAEISDEDKGNQLVQLISAETLTEEVLNNSGVTADKLLEIMSQKYSTAGKFSAEENRAVLGIRYEMDLRKLANYDPYILAEDIDVSFISLLSDGKYAGVKVESTSTREYETMYAAHILGTVGRMQKEDWEELKDQGYDMNDWIGRDGVEQAFEEYLKGTDGRRVVSTNKDGKVTGEYYSKEPEPGNTVELTIDLNLQQAVEEILTDTITEMNKKDGMTSRGAAAVVERVGTGEILALASYPTFDLSSYRQNFQQLNNDPASPLFNRATQGTYAPGSTLKPLTAIAALEENKITINEKINCPRTWRYPGDPKSYANCWYRGHHGDLNVTGALAVSCNYFFSEMGYRLGMDTLREYLMKFGLGKPTGLEIGDASGLLPENPEGQNQAPWAAFGQANQLYSPIQLANYISTLVSGGKHCDTHLLKAVKSYDNGEVIKVGDCSPKDIIDIPEDHLQAVKEGMRDLTTGSLSVYFKDCIVSAGAKTGTAQVYRDTKENGVFVCFAPYEEPEISVAIVIEKGGSGSALASSAVKILNAYFSADEVGTAIISENQLLP